MLSLKRLAFLALVASLVTACGGGGSSSSSSGSNPPSNQEPDSSLTEPAVPEYTGLKTASTINRMAAATQADVVLHSLSDFTSAIGNPLQPVMTRLSFGPSSINDSVTHCDQGGFSLNGSYNESIRQFDVIVTYSECVLGGSLYNGELAMQYVPATHSYLYFYDFDVLNVDYRTFEIIHDNETVIYNGQVSREIRQRMRDSVNHWVLEVEASTLAIDTAVEHQRWIESLHFIKEIDGYGAYIILNEFVAAEGRIYDSNYGYFDISFIEPEHAGLPTIKVAGANSALHLGFYGAYHSQFNLGADLDNDGVIDAANDISLFGSIRYPNENTEPSISINSNAEDFAVSVGDSLNIDLVAYDEEFHLLDYEWTLVSAPEGSTAVINVLGLDSLSFSPDLRGDYVFEFTANDGELSNSEQFTFSAYREQPVVSFDHPESVNRGDTIEFDLVIDNADPNEPYPMRLAYAPVGMSMDSEGHITWVADQLVIDQQTEVNFGFYVGDEGRVILAESSMILETSANPAGVFHENDSYYNHDPVLHDIDSDGFVEIIQQTSSNYISVFEINDSEIVYEWSFPLQLNYGRSTVDIAIVNDTVLDVPLLLVASDDWISVVDLDTRSVRTIYSVEDLLDETYVDVSMLMVRDIDNDGEDEVIISYDTNAIEAVAVFDNGLAQIEWQSPVGVDVGNFLLAANMDGDAAQEIATKSGYIFDGATGENQWIYSEGINTTTTLDIDNDGADEILVSRENSYGRNSYIFIDIDNQETIEYVLEVQNRYCSDSYFGNFDDDPQAELLLRCNTNIDVFEFTDQGLELVDTIENELSSLANSRDRRVVDIAGKDYVLAKLDNYDSRYYELIDPLNQTYLTSETDINLSDIIWTKSRWVTQGDEWLLELNYDQNTDRSLYLNADASTWTIESRMDQTIHRSSNNCRYIVDLEDDGVEELVFCGWDHTYIYDSVAQEVRWQLPENDASLKELFFFDINNDGVKEIIEHRGRNILVFDMASETLLFSDEIYNSNYYYANKTWVGQLDTDTAIELIAKEDEEFRIYELSASGVSLESEITLADYRVDGPFIVVDTNNNNIKEILFADDSSRSGVRLMLIGDNRALVEKGQCDLDSVFLISQESEIFDRNVVALVNSDERLGSFSTKVAGLDLETCGRAWESSDVSWGSSTNMQWDWVNGKSRFLVPDYRSVFFVVPQ